MPILKCKMCGGEIVFSPNDVVGICDSCGSQTTLPKISEDRLASLFDRADYFRKKGEFDRAERAYESILGEDDTLAEAHWGVVLSRYGIEYVEDPNTHKRIPTCHRANWASILNDGDYEAALQYAEEPAKSLYEAEAKYIDGVQKSILAISKAEKPYDVFICYKESTDGGNRTKDSVMAQDLYERLTREGFRVFFSRITLEDKLGEQYEPYIFSALNSAKVMLVIGTDTDNFNATWVKNEWSRFIALIKEQPDKVLIPCFKEIDAYELPEELSIFQSQDMGKVGFEQDLIRGIKKIIGEQKPESNTAALEQNRVNADALVRRGKLFLEDSDWKSAEQYFDRALDVLPECADAYIGKLCVELGCQKEGQIVSKIYNRLQKDIDDLDNDTPFESLDLRKNYMNAIRFADEQTRSRLETYKNAIDNAIAETGQKKCEKYTSAIRDAQAQVDALDEEARQCDESIRQHDSEISKKKEEAALLKKDIEKKQKKLSEEKQKELEFKKQSLPGCATELIVGIPTLFICEVMIGDVAIALGAAIVLAIIAKYAVNSSIASQHNELVRNNTSLAAEIAADSQRANALEKQELSILLGERNTLASKKAEISGSKAAYQDRIKKYQLSQQKYLQNGKKTS